MVIGGANYRVTEARSNNCWNDDRNGADIAVLVLDRDVNTATPVSVWDVNNDGPEVNKTFRLIGYGDSGPVGVDYENETLVSGKLLTG